MTTLVIENRINLVQDHTYITITINVPRRNLQKMLDATKARLLNKEVVELNFNHHAGLIYACTVFVRFSNIKGYLKKDTVGSESNIEEFKNLVYNQDLRFHSDRVACFDSVGLYAFGDCGKLADIHSAYTPYFKRSGKSVLKMKTENNDFGEKRYIKHAKRWISNRKF